MESTPLSSPLLDWFRNEDRRVLDIGCGASAQAHSLRTAGVEVHGVTVSSKDGGLVRGAMKREIVVDVESWTPDYAPHYFDAFLLAHVVGRLEDPEAALKKWNVLLRPGGRVYLSVKNQGHWGARGRSAGKGFTFSSVQKLVENCGFQLLRAEARGSLPLGPIRRVLPSAAQQIERFALNRFPNLFGYEIYVCASKR